MVKRYNKSKVVTVEVDVESISKLVDENAGEAVRARVEIDLAEFEDLTLIKELERRGYAVVALGQREDFWLADLLSRCQRTNAMSLTENRELREKLGVG